MSCKTPSSCINLWCCGMKMYQIRLHRFFKLWQRLCPSAPPLLAGTSGNSCATSVGTTKWLLLLLQPLLRRLLERKGLRLHLWGFSSIKISHPTGFIMFSPCMFLGLIVLVSFALMWGVPKVSMVGHATCLLGAWISESHLNGFFFSAMQYVQPTGHGSFIDWETETQPHRFLQTLIWFLEKGQGWFWSTRKTKKQRPPDDTTVVWKHKTNWSKYWYW